MASINGINTNMAFVLNPSATAHGTAGAASTGDKVICQVDTSDNTPILAEGALGTGGLMSTGATTGEAEIGVTANFVGGQTEEALAPGYENGFDKMLAQFFGVGAAPTEQNGGEGDYLHRLTFNTSSLNPAWGTLAYEETSSTVAEYPSVAVQSLNISAENPTSYLNASFGMVANKLEQSTSTNTNAVIAAATMADTAKIVVAHDDDFWINTQAGGALSSGDQFNIVSYQLTLEKPQSHKGQIKGSSGHGAPTLDGQYTGTLTVVLQELTDGTIMSWWENATVMKSLLNIEGSQIASGDNYKFALFLPEMIVTQRPTYSPSNAGANQATVTFRLGEADSNPTGMDDTRPYVELINTRSSAYHS